MNANRFARLNAGDPLEAISAAAYNAALEAAEWVAANGNNVGMAGPAGLRPNGLILVKNDTGSDVGRWAVLGLDAPMITPTLNTPEFERLGSYSAQFSGVEPTEDHAGNFCIATEPILSGEIGRAVVSGPVFANVQIEDEAHRYADIIPGDGVKLTSAGAGKAYILWAESGTGLKRAYLQMGVFRNPSTFENLWTYSTSPVTTFDIPAGVTRILIGATGGGGGGGGGAAGGDVTTTDSNGDTSAFWKTVGEAGGGGGGGGVALSYFNDAALGGLTLTITNGTAGAGGGIGLVGFTPGFAGGNGGNTTVTSPGGTVVSVTGLGGGGGGPGLLSPGTVGGNGGAPGLGGGGSGSAHVWSRGFPGVSGAHGGGGLFAPGNPNHLYRSVAGRGGATAFDGDHVNGAGVGGDGGGGGHGGTPPSLLAQVGSPGKLGEVWIWY